MLTHGVACIGFVESTPVPQAGGEGEESGGGDGGQGWWKLKLFGEPIIV